MIWILVLAMSFFSVIVAEIGDKSQVMTISLASKYDNKSVFLGIFSGMAIITVLGVVAGSIILQYIPIIFVKFAASAVFIVFGIFTIFFQDGEEEEEVKSERKGNGLTTSFLFSLLAELGDKTQLLVITLTARYGEPILVLIGALSGLATIIGLGVIFGSKLGEIFKKDRIDLIAGCLFLILGAAFLIEILFFG